MTSRRRWRGRAVALARWCALAAVVAMSLVAAGGVTANAAETGFDVAFNSGSLWTYNPSPGGSNSGLGMMYGTSPAITILANGSYEEAFQANTGILWVVNSAGDGSSTGLGMAPGTSPAITALSDGSYEVAFNSSSGTLWTMNPSPGGSNTGLGIAAGTSPAITTLSDGSYEVAFNSSSGTLWTMNPGPGGSNTGLGVENGTSPAITTTTPTSTGTGTGTEIASIAESQVGYQDSPAGTFCNAYSAYWGAGTNCGNGNYAEEWCADFAAWVWRQAGVVFEYGGDSGDLNGAAASFYQWGADNGTWHPAGSGYVPQPGDAVIYGLNSSGTYADHVAIVTSYTPGDAGPNAVNGDWGTGSNQGVVAASDETTDNGTDSISGYVSP